MSRQPAGSGPESEQAPAILQGQVFKGCSQEILALTEVQHVKGARVRQNSQNSIFFALLSTFDTRLQHC